MVEHDVRVPARDETDRMGFFDRFYLVDVSAKHLRRLMIKFILFQFPGDELFQGFGLGRRDAPPVSKVFEGRGARTYCRTVAARFSRLVRWRAGLVCLATGLAG